MKDQLTIKELASHLPYNLKCIVKGWDEPVILTSLSTKESYECACFVTENGYMPGEIGMIHLEDITPLVHPLSDLTKPITHNGKKYCLMSLWFDVSAKEEEEYEIYKTIPEYWKTVIQTIKSTGIKHIDHGFVKLMYKHHFDVDKLIERGLAVDINQLDYAKN